MRHAARGLTLPELVLGIAVTSVIGLAVAGVTMALSTAHANNQQHSENLQAARVAAWRINRELRQCRLVTAADSSRIALWATDGNGNGRINLDEIRVVSYDATNGEIRIWRAEFPPGWPDWLKSWLNTEMDLSDLAYAPTVEVWLKNSWLSQSTLLATGAAGFHCTVSPAAPLSTLARIEITVGDGDQAVTLGAAATLRVGQTDRVVRVGGHYELD